MNREWENQYVTQRNRYPMHSPYGVYESVEQALRGERNVSRYVRSLNGLWKFKLALNPHSVPEGFEREGYDDRDWDTIPVPSNWELQKNLHKYLYGDSNGGFNGDFNRDSNGISWEGIPDGAKPVYTNILYPFPRKNETSHFELRVSKEQTELNAPFVPEENLTGCYRTSFELPEDYEGRDIFLEFGGVESCFYLWVNGIEMG